MLTKTKEEKYQENLKKVKEDPFYLRFIPKDEQTEAICLAAVRQSGWALQFAQQQTPEICLAAVQENGWALAYVKEQTPTICLAAVQQHGFALKYVQNQTKEICLAAVRQDGRALQYVQQQTLELCLEALRENVQALEYISTDYYEEVSKQTEVKLFHCQNRTIFVEKIDHQWVFTVGCQRRISKERFIQRIHQTDGGLAENPHRQEYLNLLEQF